MTPETFREQLPSDGVATTCRPGDVLEVELGREHSERYGPLGYTFLVGRRHPSRGADR